MNTLTRNQQFALLSAVVYVVAGILGFVATGFDEFAGNPDEKLIVLGLIPLHNVVHLALGAVWLASSFSPSWSRTVNIALGAGLLVAFVVGMAGAATFLNIDNAAEPDNYLHLAYGALSLYVGLKLADVVDGTTLARSA